MALFFFASAQRPAKVGLLRKPQRHFDLHGSLRLLQLHLAILSPGGKASELRVRPRRQQVLAETQTSPAFAFPDNESATRIDSRERNASTSKRNLAPRTPLTRALACRADHCDIP